MPRILGLNAVGVLVSAIVFFLIGFVFYGIIFQELWMGAMGIEPDPEVGVDTVELGKGFLISLTTAIFLGLALKKMGASDLMSALKKSAFLWLGFAVTTLAYGLLYSGYPPILFVLDSAHLLTGFLAMAAIQTLMDGKDSAS